MEHPQLVVLRQSVVAQAQFQALEFMTHDQAITTQMALDKCLNLPYLPPNLLVAILLVEETVGVRPQFTIHRQTEEARWYPLLMTTS